MSSFIVRDSLKVSDSLKVGTNVEAHFYVVRRSGKGHSELDSKILFFVETGNAGPG